MAVNETQVTGRKYRVWDDINNIWKRFSFWTKASDVELNNGTTVEGAISQINTNKANKSGGNTFTGDQTFSNIIKSKSTNVSIGTSGTNWGNAHIDIFDSNNTRVAYICPKQTSSGAVDLYISSDSNDNSNGKVYVNGVDVNELKDSLIDKVSYTVPSGATYGRVMQALANLVNFSKLNEKSSLRIGGGNAQCQINSQGLFVNIQVSGVNYSIVKYDLTNKNVFVWQTAINGTSMYDATNDSISAGTICEIWY